ncbi:MAG: hypothetical protein RMK89_11835, partial [Armatimonadota bacterium]|nr:hypothetical protein [Armatimonadota bacterium]MDW8144139.1 hypothetical protein [Armatimonadota bacterium]
PPILFLWEGEAPAEPKFGQMGKSAGRQKFNRLTGKFALPFLFHWEGEAPAEPEKFFQNRHPQQRNSIGSTRSSPSLFFVSLALCE